MTQIELFEPTPAECGPLALQHLRHADAADKAAELAASRGWESLHRSYSVLSVQHSDQAEELATLADFYRLGGVVS